MAPNLPHLLNAWEAYLSSRQAEEYIALYVHIPFCSTRCRYCIYASVPYIGESAVDEYLGALSNAMSVFSPLFAGTKIGAVYIGGGSPSLLTVAQMEHLFEIVASHFDLDLSDDHMFCFEIAPHHMDTQKIDCLASSFINRVSMGIQSFDPEVQQAEKRANPSPERISFLLGYLMASLQGKQSRVNADLMIGLEGQSLESVQRDLDILTGLEVPLITLYANRKRRSEAEQSQFEHYVTTTLIELESRFSTYELITERGGFSVANRWILKGFNHHCTKPYRTRPHLNSNLGFGYRAQSFVTPQELWYHRSGDGFVIDHDPKRDICRSALYPTMFEDGRRLIAEGVDVSQYGL